MRKNFLRSAVLGVIMLIAFGVVQATIVVHCWWYYGCSGACLCTGESHEYFGECVFMCTDENGGFSGGCGTYSSTWKCAPPLP
jgi:hypothetical protein